MKLDPTHDPDLKSWVESANEPGCDFPILRWDGPPGMALKPQKIEDTLAFMWESRYVFRPTKFAMAARGLQKDYDRVWSGFKGA